MTESVAGSVHVGLFVWHDLVTVDIERAKRFYGALFGWSFRRDTLRTPGAYTVIESGGRGIGGMLRQEAQSDGSSAHWISYVEVPEIGTALDRAEALGGTVAVPATEIPSVGRFAIVEDPQGAFLGEPGEDDLLGLYVGTPLTERSLDDIVTEPDIIDIYRLPHLELELPRDELREEIATTLIHEIAHYFGIDDDHLDEIGWG